MFAALMDNCVALKIGSHPSVKACLLDEPIPLDLGVGSSSTQSKAKQRLRKRETVPQEDAPAQLRFLSQPRDTDIRVTSEYVYDDSAGEGMTAYVVSTGANPDNPDFADMLGTTEWLWPTEELWNAYAVDEYEEPYESFTDPANHGCCVISTIAGRDFGVAKKANVVIVKTVTIQTGEGQGMFLGIYVLEAISLVIDDMHSRDEKGQSVNGKAVITFTTQIHWDPKSENDLPWINMLENAILELLELDVVVVVSSGNYKNTEGYSDDVDAYPALFAADYPGIIVAGAVTPDGMECQFSQGGPLVEVWAPGETIECADNVGTGYQVLDGTSFSSGFVSGLALYLLKLDPTLQRPGTGTTSAVVKARIIQDAYSRKEGDVEFPPAIWNGLASPLCAAVGVGEEDAEASCPLFSSAVSSSSSATWRSSTASTLRISTTTDATSEPSVVLSDPCNNGER
ncbi:hypothetical protein IMSHALPRED_011110, partial [Imshaugia aleurites]